MSPDLLGRLRFWWSPSRSPDLSTTRRRHILFLMRPGGASAYGHQRDRQWSPRCRKSETSKRKALEMAAFQDDATVSARALANYYRARAEAKKIIAARAKAQKRKEEDKARR